MKKPVILFVLPILAGQSIAQQFQTVPVTESMLRVAATYDRPKQRIPKLGSRLNEIFDLYTQKQDYRRFAEASNIRIEQDKVVVTIFPDPGFTTTRIDQHLLESFGVEVQAVATHSMRVAIPISELENVTTSLSGIGRIEEPLTPRPLATIDEGEALMNANAWQSATCTGSGTRVAVIDLGFYKFSGAVANGDLPGTVVSHDFTGTGLETGTEHGTAVAEAIYDIAPGASLYLYKIADLTDLENAENACKANNVNVINHSVAWYNASYYDGTGDVCDVANDAVSNGIIWVNAAGNDAQTHYRSVFRDAGNGTHDFSGSGGNINYFGPGDGSMYVIPAGYTIDVFLNWNAYPTTREDYDLKLYYWSRSKWIYTNVGSFNNQASGNLAPTERIHYVTPRSAPYGVAIVKHSTTVDHDLTLFNWIAPFNYQTASSSTADPASAPGVITVGAIDRINYASGPQEYFSSQGPTTDGRTKPDIASPDDCNSYAYGYWYGTSLASPHVAGCVALIHSLFPSKSDNEVKDYLYNSCTVDLGAFGEDNVYGWGKVELPFVMVNTKVWLEGPYTSGTMSTALNTAGWIPLSQPYSSAPWNYAGTESVSNIPPNVVDWMLVELRSGISSGTKVAARATFVTSDGSVVDRDGASPVAFAGVSPGSYYVVVRHRNHLAIMTASAVALSASSSLYNFTISQNAAYSTDYGLYPPMKDLGDGKFGMCAGDVNGDGTVYYLGPGNDRGALLAGIGGSVNGMASGYISQDVNLDGSAYYLGPSNDRGIILVSIGGAVNGRVYSGLPEVTKP
jgi:hypothetical protein